MSYEPSHFAEGVKSGSKAQNGKFCLQTAKNIGDVGFLGPEGSLLAWDGSIGLVFRPAFFGSLLFQDRFYGVFPVAVDFKALRFSLSLLVVHRFM